MANKSTILHGKLSRSYYDLTPAGTKVVRNPDGNGFRLVPANGGKFFPWERGHSTRDAGSIGEHAKKARALDPAKMQKVIDAMADIGKRIGTLEAARRAPPPMPTPQPASTRDALPRCTCKRAPSCICGDGHLAATPHPMPIPTKDKSMSRNPALAPNNHIVEKPRARSFAQRLRDSFAETPSRFSSQEAGRMARHIVGAGPPSAAELNVTYRQVHKGGASGQTHAADDRSETTAYAQQARAGVAPLSTPYSLNTGEGGHSAMPRGANFRGNGPGLEAVGSDLLEAFANELQKIPHGQPQRTINTYHEHYYAAKPGPARDAIDKVWSAYQRR